MPLQIGQTFHRWTLLNPLPKQQWQCRCQCGIEKSVSAWNLTQGKSKSCGCWKRELRRERSPNWKGFGKSRTQGGYVRLRNAEYPGAPDIKENRTYEHIVVMSRHLGRPLLPNENVHHKNGRRDDNRIENLELWVTHQPNGQRVRDKLEFAVEIITQYALHLSMDERRSLISSIQQIPIVPLIQ
jgi:hypothetical protein